MSNDKINEILSIDVASDEDLIKKYCKCGSATHQRASFKNCQLNKNNITITYNIAKNIIFLESIIIGPNIINNRLYIGKMNCSCIHCKALLFNNEKI